MADALTPEQQKFIQLCIKGLADRNLSNSATHKERLKLELKEINVQAEHEYFLTLVNKKLKFSRNENNLLVAVLLGLCDNFDINTPPAYVQGEFPDIDMDYLPEIQKWIKNDWAPKKFGRENVCSITAYGKLGIKSSILDMTKIHGISKDEIQGITTSMEDKDDEGEILKWDKALSMYPAFKAYCEKNPEIASLAQTLISRRKSASMHAGGLIISSVPISDFVPLEVRSVDKDNKYGVIVAAWSEGQATQDLGPVGLVKFDVLVVDGLMQIALTCDLLRKRRGIESVCALPNRRNWSDTSYLDDPASIAMANRADLKCCFQFGSEGIRKLVKKGGVTCFDDIATYSAIFRPGPLGMGMGERFCLRKRGLEEYELHPLLQPILGATYGVMAYQEQVMKILNIVGNIPLIHCEKIRKAISKKKVELFAKYKEMFLVNGQKNLGESLEYVQNLWETIESFADYGFNKSHSYAYSYITARQLMLKSHWPLEFYTAVLMCADEVDKLKTIKMDAMNHGIEVLPVHINKSKANFSIVDHEDTGKIYYGFSNLKTIGAEVAAKIESLQPFTSFADFLDRFGTDAKVVKCLIALNVFDEPYERLTLYKFYEYYKDKFTKRRDCGKRHEEATEKRLEKLKALINSTDISAELKEKLAVYDNEDVYDQWTALFSTVERTEEYKSKGVIKTRQKSVAEMLHALRKDHESKVKLFESKEKIAEEAPPSIDSFNPHKFTFKEKELEKLAPYLEVITQPDTKLAEKMYYGFQWIHDLEEAPEYAGFTIDKFLGEAELQGNIVGCIEVQVIKCERKDFKSGNGFAYDAVVEDANGKEIVVRFWKDDYDRFQDDLVPGTLMKMRVKPPVGSFPSFNFESPPRHERWKLPKNRVDDCRIVVMEKAAPKAKTNVVDLTDEFTLEIL